MNEVQRGLDRLRGQAHKRLPGIRRPGWLKYLAMLGPGLIAANAGNDAAGIATYATVGARYGYSLLWMLVLITVSMGVVQEMVARLGAITGKGLSDLIREQFGVRWTAFAMLTILVANAGTVVAEFAGIAAAFELFAFPRWLTVPLAAAAVLALHLPPGARREEPLHHVVTVGAERVLQVLARAGAVAVEREGEAQDAES